MTSANVVKYDIIENGEVLFTERHHVLCEKDWSKLFEFYYTRKETKTLKGVEMIAYGENEYEEPWQNEPVPLAIKLRDKYFQSELIKYLESKLFGK